MVLFINRRLTSGISLGEKLKNRRLEKNVSLSEITKQIKIKQSYLTALENGTYDQLPGEVYACGFLEHYAKFLNLNYRSLKKDFQREWRKYQQNNKESASDTTLRQRVRRTHLIIVPKIVRKIVVAIIILACLVYLGLEIKTIIQPPWLTINQPVNNLITEQYQVIVVGQTEPEVSIVINGQLVLGDRQGNFNQIVDLSSGVNIIKITARKKHSREQIVYRRVLVVDNTVE